jgi:hypothetical protein
MEGLAVTYSILSLTTSFDSGELEAAFDAASLPAGATSATWFVNVSVPRALSNGLIQLSVHGTDGAGNSARPVVSNVWERDTVRPVTAASLVPSPRLHYLADEGLTVVNASLVDLRLFAPEADDVSLRGFQAVVSQQDGGDLRTFTYEVDGGDVPLPLPWDSLLTVTVVRGPRSSRVCTPLSGLAGRVRVRVGSDWSAGTMRWCRRRSAPPPPPRVLAHRQHAFVVPLFSTDHLRCRRQHRQCRGAVLAGAARAASGNPCVSAARCHLQ